MGARTPLRTLTAMLALAACEPTPPLSETPPACDADNAGLTLPDGFCATVFAETGGQPRQLVAFHTGDVYVTMLSGPVLALRDTNRDGHADLTATVGRGHHTGMARAGDYLFVDAVPNILRYRLEPPALAPLTPPDTIVRGLPTGGHGSRSVAVDGLGNLFVAIGSTGNMCSQNADPCPELDQRAGVWRFAAHTLNQQTSAAARYATGVRNAVAMAVNPGDNRLYVVQHGRDNLQNFPALFDLDAAAENPAEELLRVEEGDDFGWPYCYYDFAAGARVLAPEYGGNRALTGRCASTVPPRAVFPGHWAPNGLVFHPAATWPGPWRGGAFVAFHGSWNRAPRPQAGFKVVFVPGTPWGGWGPAWEVFADGFAGAGTIASPGDAAHRPSGLAVGADDALYVSDDHGGRIYRIIYRNR